MAGDSTFHYIMPWVLDMTSAPDLALDHRSVTPGRAGAAGWRDLTRTKNRSAMRARLVFVLGVLSKSHPRVLAILRVRDARSHAI